MYLVNGVYTRLKICKSWVANLGPLKRGTTPLIITQVSDVFWLPMYEFHKHKYLYVKIFSLATVKSCVIVGHFGRCQIYHLCTCHGLVLRLKCLSYLSGDNEHTHPCESEDELRVQQGDGELTDESYMKKQPGQKKAHSSVARCQKKNLLQRMSELGHPHMGLPT